MKSQAVSKTLLQSLPAVDRLLVLAEKDAGLRALPKAVVTRALRDSIDDLRQRILGGQTAVTEADLVPRAVLAHAAERARRLVAPNLVRTINATGVVVHTNLGRSLLCPEALENLTRIAAHYSNLEFDLAAGQRGSRYSAVEEILCEISGAEAALVVNNNAGAVLLALETLARDREVIVSRGELVEIGGAFRIPDVMARSGCVLKEVGTTNRTHLRDYRDAIGEETGLLLKVHTSNYNVVGFTKAVTGKELAKLGRDSQLPVMEDLGSGTFIDLSRYGLMYEPTVQEAVAAGIDVVTFSGDKLLGGPQAGIILGRRSLLEAIKKNPITRALRIDKMTLAALESTLHLYRDEAAAVQRIPTLRMLLEKKGSIEERAHRLKEMLFAQQRKDLSVVVLDCSSRAGGGSLPLLDLPSCCLAVEIEGWRPDALERFMRAYTPPVIGRIEGDRFLLDMRTVQTGELDTIAAALAATRKGTSP
jgi:L-seryl-tRNA(Ser) seleniumtransferase